MSAQTFHPTPLMALTRPFSPKFDNSALRERMGAIALVLSLHVSLGLAWIMKPEEPPVVLPEMSVSIAMPQPEVVQPQVQPEPQPPKLQPKVEKTEQPIPKPIVQDVAEAPPQPLPVVAPIAATSPAPAPPKSAPVAAPPVNTEPDYKANYLNNPFPSYPMVARRMGYRGKVVLNVEVLAEGKAGQVLLHTSSGYDSLDNAALQTVKGWRFTPAHRLGQPVTLWFLVPIKFSLEGNEA